MIMIHNLHQEKVAIRLSIKPPVVVRGKLLFFFPNFWVELIRFTTKRNHHSQFVCACQLQAEELVHR